MAECCTGGVTDTSVNGQRSGVVAAPQVRNLDKNPTPAAGAGSVLPRKWESSTRRGVQISQSSLSIGPT